MRWHVIDRKNPAMAAQIRAVPVVPDLAGLGKLERNCFCRVCPIENTYHQAIAQLDESCLQTVIFKFGRYSGWRQELLQKCQASGRDPGGSISGKHNAAAGVSRCGMKLKFLIGEISGQKDRFRIVPPKLSVLQISIESLPGLRLEVRPRALDVTGPARAVNQAERRPDRMVAAKNKTVSRAAANRFHALAIGLYPRCPGIMEPPAVHRAPEIGVELEVSAAPLFAHGAEGFFKMLLHLGMSAVERIPRAVTPSAKSYLAGNERLTIGAPDEPLRMLLEDVRTLLGDKRRHPYGRLKAPFANFLQHCDNVSAKCLAGFEPVAHGGLVAIINLHVFQFGNLLRDYVQILQYLLGCNSRSKAIPRTPAGGRRLEKLLRMIFLDPRCEVLQQFGTVGVFLHHQSLKLPPLPPPPFHPSSIPDPFDRSPSHTHPAAA